MKKLLNDFADGAKRIAKDYQVATLNGRLYLGLSQGL